MSSEHKGLIVQKLLEAAYQQEFDFGQNHDTCETGQVS